MLIRLVLQQALFQLHCLFSQRQYFSYSRKDSSFFYSKITGGWSYTTLFLKSLNLTQFLITGKLLSTEKPLTTSPIVVPAPGSKLASETNTTIL